MGGGHVRHSVGAVALLVVAGALHGSGAGEAGEAPREIARVVDAGVDQEGARGSELLRAVAGTPPVACELMVQALGNRWGATSVRPHVYPPLAATGSERRLAEWAWTAGPEGEDGAALIDALGSPDPCVQRVATRLLAYVDDPATLAAVSNLARSGAGRVRLAAIMALGEGAREDAAEVLAAGLGDPDPEVRRAAAWAAAGSGRHAPLRALTAGLDNRDAVLRANVAWALGRLQRPEAIAPLVRALDDREADVRFNAAWALGEIEDERAIPPLASVLSGDRSPEVRRAAAWALGRIER